MSAKQAAIQDIKDDLKQQSKSFLAFHKQLNPIMDEIVNTYIQQQSNL